MKRNENLVLYYVSGFGFGHLTRSLAIIEALLELDSGLQIIIRCHPGQTSFAAAYLKSFGNRVELTQFESQFQILFDEKKWCIDETATRSEVLRWISSLPQSVERELLRIPGEIRLVLSDIVPEAFAVAKAAAVPGIAISNYTWYEVAAGFCDRTRLTGLRQLYEVADLLLEYELSTQDELPIRKRESVGLVCRPFDPLRIAAIRHQFKRPGRPLIFLSIGGALKLEKIDLSPDYDYLYTRGIDPGSQIAANAVPVDSLDTQNYLAACDAVVTKCGWSTVTETLIAGKPLFLVRSANGWAEERYVLQRLREWGAAVEMEATDLRSLTSLSLVQKPREYKNNVLGVAESLLKLIVEK